MFDQVHVAQLQLGKASSSLESQFLTTGSELEGLAQLANQFVKQVEKLVGLASGATCDEFVFQSAIRLVENSVQYLVECRDQTGQMLERLRTYRLKIENLLGMDTELQRTMLPLRFVQTLFKSESAPLGLEVQQMFIALTQEIERLHGQVREIFGTKFKQLEETQSRISQVIARLETETHSLEQVTTTKKAEIESSLQILRQEMNSNRQRDVQISRLSKDLATETEQVVMGLQFQDIINQKLQHVTAALSRMEEQFGELQRGPDAATTRGALQFLHQSSRLEASQIQTVRKELATAETTIRTGVERILSHLSEIDSRCLSLKEFKSLTTSFDGIVQVLVDMIEEVRKIIEMAVHSAAQAYELLQPLGNLATDLTGIVRGISARIHLLGLNAQVQAAVAGQNRRAAGLEVLSAHTNEISEATNRISERAAEELDTLAAGLAESVKTFEQLHAHGLAQHTRLNKQGCAEEQQLHTFRDTAFETLREIGTSLDQIREQAQHALNTVAFAEFHEVTLPALQEPLAAIAEAAKLLLDTRGWTVGQADLVADFQRDYTMQSEREVFAGVASACPSLPAAKEGAGQDTGAELFLESAGPPGNVPAEREENEAMIAGEACKTGLGDNVELF